MSYVRFGSDGSDVYVFTSAAGIECCFCALQERKWVEEPGALLGGYLHDVGPHLRNVFRSNRGMVDHLLRHRAAGHTVPEDALVRLRDPADAAENRRIWAETAAERGAEE